MAPKPTANDDEQTETLRDVYGAIDPDDVEDREDWDPALEPQGLVPETAEDGRSFHVAAWDGGVSDLKGLDDMNIYDVREGAPAVVVYLSTHGGVQAFAGELTSGLSGYGRRVEVRDGDDVREVVNVDGQDRFEAVRTDTGRHVGTMLDVRLTRPWGALADYYELPDGVDTLYEVVEVYDDREEVVAVEPTRSAANQARTAHTVAYGEEEPTGLLVRERGDDEEDDVEDDDDDDDEPTFQYDESDMASLPDVDDALEAAIKADDDDDGPDPVDDVADADRGDVLTVRYEDEDGDERERDVTVEVNTLDPSETQEFGVDKAKLYTAKGRSGTDVVVYPDGTLRAKPRFNANGRGHDGTLLAVERADDDDARTDGGEGDVEHGDGGRPVEGNRRGVAGDPVPDAEYGDGPEDLTPDVEPPHECRENLMERHDDPALPDYIDHHECAVCGRWFEHDTEADTWEADR